MAGLVVPAMAAAAVEQGLGAIAARLAEVAATVATIVAGAVTAAAAMMTLTTAGARLTGIGAKAATGMVPAARGAVPLPTATRLLLALLVPHLADDLSLLPLLRPSTTPTASSLPTMTSGEPQPSRCDAGCATSLRRRSQRAVGTMALSSPVQVFSRWRSP